LILIYLLIVIFAPGFDIEKQPIPVSAAPAEPLFDFRHDIRFMVEDMAVSAWLYLPTDLSIPVPCVILNNGFGGTKDIVLERYALRFRDAGLAVISYDYRYFGESEGEPRQLFSMSAQIADCKGAITFARGRPEIDPQRIAIWGTSAGGGYGLYIAAKDSHISCVIAQCAGLDSDEDAEMALEREGIGFFLRLLMHAQRDKGRMRFGLSEHKIPIVGRSGTLAMLRAPGAFEGYSQLVNNRFINEVCARVLLMTDGFNPIDYAPRVKCPVLIQICEKDNLVSPRSGLNTAEKLGQYAEVKQYPIGHFDIYTGDDFERAVTDQIKFLNINLKM
jgi:cephalosporin-C deacetylase-like acetyl esterase